jgi:hypothetical protein
LRHSLRGEREFSVGVFDGSGLNVDDNDALGFELVVEGFGTVLDSCLPLPIREKFPVICDDDPVALWIGSFLNVDLKIDGAHDTIAEHFVN